MPTIKTLTEDDVTGTIDIQHEDMQLEGNASAIDSETDARVINSDDEKPATIAFLSAESLDTGHVAAHEGRSYSLYLVPAAESETGRPAIVLHESIGANSWPMRAHHNRWACVGSYGPSVVGESVLKLLRDMEGSLVALSDAYQGTEWDGSNHRGIWSGDAIDIAGNIAMAWEQGLSELESYWDADIYYGDTSWPEMAAEAHIDAERALRDDWRALICPVTEALQACQDAHVSGTAELVEERIESYRTRV